MFLNSGFVVAVPYNANYYTVGLTLSLARIGAQIEAVETTFSSL